MLKGVFNLFLVFIICITAAGMPVDQDTFDFSLKIPIQQKNNQITYSIESNKSTLQNPTTINFLIESKISMEKSTNEQKESFILDIYQEDQRISSLKASDFIITQINESESEIIYTMNISQENLRLQSGSYIFRIYSDSKDFKDVAPFQLNITYKSVAPYLAAKNDMDRGMMNLTLYFPDNIIGKYLIPITRFVKYDRATLRTTINNLHEGSAPLGFENPIPNIPRLQVNGDIVTVHLPNDLGKYNENVTDGHFALNSLVDSLTSIPGINRVKFLVNGKESDHIFSGYSTSSIFEPNTENPRAYLGMDINEIRTLLVPVDVLLVDEERLYSDIFDILQTGIQDGSVLDNMIPTVPEDIKLLNASRNNQTMILNLSKEFLYAYPERTDLQRMMIDSVVFSYTSIKNVQQVQILVENQVVESFAGLQLTKPIFKPKYINPEKE